MVQRIVPPFTGKGKNARSATNKAVQEFKIRLSCAIKEHIQALEDQKRDIDHKISNLREWQQRLKHSTLNKLMHQNQHHQHQHHKGVSQCAPKTSHVP